jgi:hypothetical protein
MKVKYHGGNFRATAGGKVYKAGEEFDLSREKIRAMRKAGLVFTAVSEDDTLPEDDTLNLPATTFADEPGPEDTITAETS